jgi:capsular exopolysaccharide synthesis family protein
MKEADDTVDLKRIIFRILPYWPLAPLLIMLFLTGAHLYLKYQVPVFIVTARVVVNDGEQEKGNNLIQALRPNNADKETEKEKEILQSKALVTQVVRDQQLNIQWTKKGRVSKIPQYGNLPLELWLESPDSVITMVTGIVHLLPNKLVEFNNKIYPIDTLVQSPFGKIRWQLYDANQFTNEWNLAIFPVKTAAQSFRGQLSATPITKQSSIIDLVLQETIPARGELFLNSLLEQYGKNNVAFKNRVYQNTVKFLEERLRIVVDELEGVEAKLEHYKSREGIFNLSAQGDFFLSQLKETDQKAGETDLQLTVLKKIEEYVNSRNRTAQTVPASLGLSDPILLSLLNQLYQTEFEEEKLRKLSGDKNPQLEVLEESLQKLRPSILASIRNLRISLQSSKDKLSLEEALLQSELKGIPQKERSLLEISRQQQIKNSIYTYLLQKREESVTAAAAQVPNHRVINLPELSGQIAPQPAIVYGMSFAIALALLIIFIYIKEFTGNKILFSGDLEKATGIPLLGELVFSHRSEDTTLIQPNERLLIAEQLRDLRTNLSYTNVQKEGAQVLLITSSISGEGKSFLTVNLAASLTRVEKKVLVMECDLRKPVISKKLGVPKGKGLTDYLIGNAIFEEIVRPVGTIENFFLISSGPVPPNPVELLMNGKFEPLLDRLKEQFDYILIDSPPAAILTDAKVLAMVADSTLYVVRYNYTSYDFLAFIRSQALRKTLPRISLIFNGVVRKKVPGYGYGNEYGYGYGYGYIKDEPKFKK